MRFTTFNGNIEHLVAAFTLQFSWAALRAYNKKGQEDLEKKKLTTSKCLNTDWKHRQIQVFTKSVKKNSSNTDLLFNIFKWWGRDDRKTHKENICLWVAERTQPVIVLLTWKQQSQDNIWHESICKSREAPIDQPQAAISQYSVISWALVF